MKNSYNLKVYSPGFQAIEWGFDYSQCVDIDTALAQPHKIAVLPVYHNRKTEFSYKPEFDNIPLDKFDLVLFTEIEWRSQKELISWIDTTGVTNWLLHIAGRWLDEPLHPRVMYRPAWSFNFLRWNPPRTDFPLNRPFSFECLLGARREHRDFAMLSLQNSGLRDKNIVTYRDLFVGHWIDKTPERVVQCFPNEVLEYPYVSPNLDPAWEVKEQMDPSVSGIVPWEIYNRSWFSVVCETLAKDFYGRRIFLSAEKIGKCLHARRFFVILGIQGFLQHYRDWGFETFGDVIDESYDNEADDIVRWSKAMDQVNWLCSQDLAGLLTKLHPRLDHNHHRLYELDKEIQQQLQDFVIAYLK